MIHQYIMGNVNGQKQKVGVMVGIVDDSDQIRIGWSRVNISAGDQFDRDHGIQIASDRCHSKQFVPAPHSIKSALHNFNHRCSRYFRDDNKEKIVIKPTFHGMLVADPQGMLKQEA